MHLIAPSRGKEEKKCSQLKGVLFRCLNTALDTSRAPYYSERKEKEKETLAIEAEHPLPHYNTQGPLLQKHKACQVLTKPLSWPELKHVER